MVILGKIDMVVKNKTSIDRTKKAKFKSNIYHYSQVNFAHNSNKIEDIILISD